MPDLSLWFELSRAEQRVLTKLFGGGTLRADDPIKLVRLRAHGLINDQGLTVAGLRLFLAALRHQQAVWRQRLAA